MKIPVSLHLEPQEGVAQRTRGRPFWNVLMAMDEGVKARDARADLVRASPELVFTMLPMTPSFAFARYTRPLLCAIYSAPHCSCTLLQVASGSNLETEA